MLNILKRFLRNDGTLIAHCVKVSMGLLKLKCNWVKFQVSNIECEDISLVLL